MEISPFINLFVFLLHFNIFVAKETITLYWITDDFLRIEMRKDKRLAFHTNAN